MDLQQSLSLHLYLTVHICCTQFVHRYNWRYIWKNKGLYNSVLSALFISTLSLYCLQIGNLRTKSNHWHCLLFTITNKTFYSLVNFKDLRHLPESKIKKFIHEPANHGRSVQHRDSVQQTAPIVSATLATAQTRGVNGKHG